MATIITRCWDARLNHRRPDCEIRRGLVIAGLVGVCLQAIFWTSQNRRVPGSHKAGSQCAIGWVLSALMHRL